MPKRYFQKFAKYYGSFRGAYNIRRSITADFASAFNLTHGKAQEMVDFFVDKLLSNLYNGVRIRFDDVFVIYLEPYHSYIHKFYNFQIKQNDEAHKPSHWGLKIHLSKPGFKKINDSMGIPDERDFRSPNE